MVVEYHDIFVSYAHLDNAPLPGVDTGWVTELIRGVRIQLARQLGRSDNFKLWMDHELSGNDAVTPEIEVALARSRTVLLILSKPYLASRWCQKELKDFLDRHPASSHRVFLVEPEPIDRPEALHDLLGYRFWEKSSEDKVIRYGWPAPNPEQVPYYQRIDDLARDLAKVLGTGDPQPQALVVSPAAQPNTDSVFLAETSPDLADQREAMKRFLEQHGVKVLPVGGYPPPPKLEQRMVQDLAVCKLYIQLLSLNPADGWPFYYYQQAMKADIKRLVWHSKAIDPQQVTDKDHQTLLTDPAILVSSDVDLQREVISRLASPTTHLDHVGLLLFVNHDPKDTSERTALLKELKRRKIGYIAPPSEGTLSVQELKENALACDALLIIAYSADVSWVQGQIRLLSPYLRLRNPPIRGTGLCHEPGVDLGVWLPDMIDIECTKRCPVTCIDQFLRGISL